MLPGLMQQTPLLISSILKYSATAHSSRGVTSRSTDGSLWTYDYGRLEERCRRAASALQGLGIAPGDRVTTLAWNTHRHLELFYAVPGLGAVLHTANPRLFDDQIVYTINHAESVVLFFEDNLSEIIERIAPKLTTVRDFIALTDAATHEAVRFKSLSYEELIDQQLGSVDWPQFSEEAAAFLCYTSGTTGLPKGVLYSHRAAVLHAMAAGLNSAFGFTSFDVVMPCASLYHATAWGLPFVAPLCGAKLVLPGDRMDGASLHQLVEGEGVTFSGGVPTIWTGYLAYLEKTQKAPTTLRRLVIGGSAVPRAMAENFKRRYGVDVLQLWGMTETCPLGVVATPTPALAARGADVMQDVIWTRQGRLQLGIELRTVDESGIDAPRDGRTPGALLVRGPWTIRRYFKEAADATDQAGWFNTGDIATLDADGFMRITDRLKDVIKSGGEWISSIDLENAALACPGVKVAAVIGVPHPKWEERPLLIIEAHEGEVITRDMIIAHLERQVAKWWLPERVVFAPIPLTATGKIDKKLLRQNFLSVPQ